MPQLDIFLWFSQVFWLLIFLIFFTSFVFVLYIPLTYFMEMSPYYVLNIHYNRFNSLLWFHVNVQDFYSYYKGIY